MSWLITFNLFNASILNKSIISLNSSAYFAAWMETYSNFITSITIFRNQAIGQKRHFSLNSITFNWDMYLLHYPISIINESCAKTTKHHMQNKWYNQWAKYFIIADCYVINCHYQKKTSHNLKKKKMPMRLKQESYVNFKSYGTQTFSVPHDRDDWLFLKLWLAAFMEFMGQ